MLKNDKLKKPVGGSHRTGFSKILIKKVLPVFLLTGFLFSPFKINGVYAQILETMEKTESLEFDKYDDLLEYTENTKTKEVIYNYKTNIVGQQTFNNLNENIDKRGEDIEFYINPNTGQKYSKIYSGKQYRKIEKDWYKFETATTTENNFFMELEKTVPVENFFDKMISFFEFKETIAQTATTTIYSAGGDGEIYATNADWTTLINLSTGTAYPTNTTGFIRSRGGTPFELSRLFFSFDTSLLSAYTINSAEFNYYTTQVQLASNFYVRLVETTQNSGTTLINEDLDQTTSTQLGDSDKLNSTTGWRNIVLNATGISLINKTGYTKLGLREVTNDIGDVDPTTSSWVYIALSETAGTGNDPYLLIEYTEVEEEPTATTTADLYPCAIPENTLIQRFTGCENIYTTSTTTPGEVRFFYYDIPLILYIVFLIFCTGPLIIIILYIYVRKKR